MKLVERLRRISPIWWVAIFAIVLILPGLGSFGFWDPWELKLAERARDMARSDALFDVTLNRRFTAEPPLDLGLNALGMRVFGVSEFGGRISHALFGIFTVLAVYWAGAGLFRRRAAALSALVLASMPLFVFESRQLTSDMPLVAGLTLALGGFGRLAWPGYGKRKIRDLIVAAVGLLLGLFSGGALLGVVLPTLSITMAVVVGWGLRPRSVDDPAADKLALPGQGDHVPADKTLGASLFAPHPLGGFALIGAATIGVLFLVLTLTRANVAGHYSLLLGGVPRGGTPSVTFDYIVRQLGFGLFPWSALAIFALGRPLIRLGGGDDPADDAA